MGGTTRDELLCVDLNLATTALPAVASMNTISNGMYQMLIDSVWFAGAVSHSTRTPIVRTAVTYENETARE